MDIVPHRRRQRAALGGALLGSAARAIVDGVRIKNMEQLVRRAAGAGADRLQVEARYPKSRNAVQRKMGPQQTRRLPDGDISKPSSSSYSGTPGVIIGQSPVVAPLRIRAEGIIKLTNTAANICDTYLRVALDDGLGTTSGTIAAYCPRLASYKPLFRRYQLKKLTLQWVPSVSDTVDGAVAVCYDTDIRLGQINTVGNALLRPAHFMTPMRMAGGRLVFTPRTRVDKEERYCATATSGGTTRAPEETQYGTIAVVADNTLANGAAVGYLRIMVDVEFTDQI